MSPTPTANGTGLSEVVNKLFTNNPALLVVAIFMLWASGRIQSPEENLGMLTPLESRLRAVEVSHGDVMATLRRNSENIQELRTDSKTHDSMGGHMRMEFRMKFIEDWIRRRGGEIPEKPDHLPANLAGELRQ